MLMNPKILLLEDEINVGSTLSDRMRIEGYDLQWCQSRAAAMNALEGARFDLVLLDVQLPDGSGFDVARTIRTQTPGTAIVFLTAAGTPEDRIHGLELGAEDYVVKPFHTKELLLRVRNVLKRMAFVSAAGETESDFVSIGKARVQFREYVLESEAEKHRLSHKECTLLKLLHDKQGQVVSRDEILDLVWSEDEYPTPRTIDNFVMRLRKMVEPDPENPTVIRSVRGVGYLMERNK
jgi:two-component system alkaline phosphatase synthesis response regulator PhoP